MRVQGRANQRYALLFRDYLRAHPATAEAYAELKRRLAQHLADPRMYPEVKDPAVDLIYLAAEEVGGGQALAARAIRCITWVRRACSHPRKGPLHGGKRTVGDRA